MEDVFARKVENTESNGHAAERRDHDHVQWRDIIGRIGIREGLVRLDREPVDLRNNENALVDVERVVERACIEDGPFLDRTDLELRHDAFAKLLAVDIEVVDVDDPALLNLRQLLQRERPSDVWSRFPQRVCRLGCEHRRISGHRFPIDNNGRQHIVVALATQIQPRFFPTPTVHEVVGARCGGSGNRHRNPVARAEHSQGGDIVHP